jgi:hypothetical protein
MVQLNTDVNMSHEATNIETTLAAGRLSQAARGVRIVANRHESFENLEQRRLLTGSDPVAVPGTYVADEGSSIMLDGSGSTDSDGTITSYEWDLFHNPSFGFRPMVTGSGFPLSSGDDGVRSLALRVTDNDGNTDVATFDVTFNNVAPIVTYTGNGSVDEGVSYDLAWSVTDPGDDTISGFRIDWGDGSGIETFAAGDSSASHTFAQPGTFNVVLTTVDEDGNHAASAHSVTVNNVVPIVTVGGDETGIEGSPAEITFSSPNFGDNIYAYLVDWGDNTYDYVGGRLSSLRHIYADNGNYTVTVRAFANDGDMGTATHDISIANALPAPATSAVPQIAIEEGTSVTINGLINDPGTADTHTFGWAVFKDGDPFTLAGGEADDQQDLTFVAREDGTYHVRFEVTDDDGGNASVTTSTFTVTNAAPTVAITGNPGNVDEGVAVNLGSTVTDPGTNNAAPIYAWSVIKDGVAVDLTGVTTDAANFAFTPVDNGAYVITLTATDDGGVTGSTMASLTVDNANPVVTIGNQPSGNVDEGTSVTLSTSVVDVDADLAGLTYQWSLTLDGNPVILGSVPSNGDSFTFTAATEGDYVATVVVTDKDGGSHTVASNAITTVNAAPTGTLTADQTGTEGQAITASVDVTDPGNDTLLYAWSLQKDGQAVDVSGLITDQASFTFTPADNGTYHATIVVDDQEGGTISATTAPIVVANAAPGVTIDNVPASPVNEGDLVSLASTVNDVLADANPTYAWSVTKDGDAFATGSNATFDFTPDDNGTYAVTLTVTDKDGGATTETATVTAVNVAPTADVTGEPIVQTFEGTAVTLSADVTDVGSADTFTYAWSLKKDGDSIDISALTTDAQTFTFTPTDNGSYLATVVVTDDDSGTVTSSSSVIAIDNAEPTGSINGIPSGSVEEGNLLSLAAVATDAGSADTHTYAWSGTYNDGLGGGAQPIDLSSVTTTAAMFEFTPIGSGDYVFTVTITDDDGGTASVNTGAIAVTNAAPTVTITGDAVTPDEGTAVTVSAAATDIGGGTTFTYAWTLKKDGDPVDVSALTTDEANFTFTPTDNGSYLASVVVTDPQNAATTANSQAIVVGNAAPEASIINPGSVNEGQDLVFQGGVSDAGAADTHTYAWTLKKDGVAVDLTGVTTDAANLTYTTLDDGDYVAELTVTDDDGDSDVFTAAAVSVANLAPTGTAQVGTAGPNYNEGGVITSSASASDIAADTLSYAWTVLNGIGDPVDLSTHTTDAASFDFTPADNGSYTIKVTVSDEDGGSVELTAGNMTVDNVAPTATISSDPVNATETAPVSFTANVVDPGSDDTHSYSWTITKDGSNYGNFATTQPTITFTPADNGNYQVSLTVFDDDGATGTASSGTFAVANAKPIVTATITAPQDAEEGDNLLVNASVTDGAGDTHTMDFSLWLVDPQGGPATMVQSVTGVIGNSHTFVAPDNGTFYAEVKARDDEGLLSDPVATSQVSVTNVDPIAAIIGAPGNAINEGDAVNLAADVTDAGSADTHSYAWTLTKDGVAYDPQIALDTANLAFNPGDNGTFIASLTVTDDDGGSVIATPVTITVENLAPVPTITGTAGSIDNSIDEGTTISLTADAGDAGLDDTHTFAWTVSKNGTADFATGTGMVFSFTPDDDGTYVATVTATDDDSAVGTANVSINVDNAAPTAAITGTPTGTVDEGSEIGFAVTVADAGSADTHSYLWSVTKDGANYDLTGFGTTNDTFAFIPDNQGTYVVSVAVTDDDNGTVTVNTTDITVINAAPTVGISGDTVTPDEGTPFTLTASVNDAGDTGHTFAWTLTKDGVAVDLTAVTSDQQSFTYTPTDEGAYVASVSVDDTEGGVTAVDSATIAVSNVPAVVTLTDAAFGDEGTTLTFSAAATDAGTDDSHTYNWRLFKGGVELDLTGVTIDQSSFSYDTTDDGAYVARVTVNDGTDDTVEDSNLILVSNVAPTATVSDSGDDTEGQLLTFTASASDAGTDDTFSYAWTLTKDGNAVDLTNATTDGQFFSHAATDEGSYVATVVVTDDDGGSVTSISRTVVVSNVAPSVTINGVPTGNVDEGTPITFTAAATDPGADDTLTYTWFVEEAMIPIDLTGVTTDQPTFTFTPPDQGVYDIYVTVSDGTTSTMAWEAIVAVNVAPGVVVNVAPGTAVDAGTEVTFGTVVTDAADDTSFTFNWTLSKDGQPVDLTGITTTNDSLVVNLPGRGEYVATVSVDDGEGGVSQAMSQPVVAANVAPTVSVVDAQPGDEGVTLSFAATASDSPDETLSYRWELYNNGLRVDLTGVTTDAATFNYVTRDDGAYYAFVVVGDGDTDTVGTSATVVVANVAPTAVVADNGDTTEGGLMAFTATASDVGLDDTFTYAWTLTKDGDPVDLSAYNTGGSLLEVDAGGDGSYVATVVVTDDDGDAVTETSRTLVVTNAAPSVVVTGAPVGNANEGVQINLLADAIDAGGDPMTFAWSLTKDGDPVDLTGTTTDATAFSFTPDNEGAFVATVVVSDGLDSTQVVSTITVVNVAPTVAVAVHPGTSVNEGDQVLFGTLVTDAPADTSFTYQWSLTKDGQPVDLTGVNTNLPTLTYNVPDNGDYVASVVVTDSASASTTATSATVTAGNVAPTSVVLDANNSPAEGDSLAFTVNPSDAGSDDTFTYSWRLFRDNTPLNLDNVTSDGPTLQYTADQDGVYLARATVTDKDGASVTNDSVAVVVTNAAPTVTINGNTTADEGDLASFAAVVSDAGTLDTHTYQWSVTKDGQAFDLSGVNTTGASFDLPLGDDGNYEVTVAVTDGIDGATTSQTIAVSNAAPTVTLDSIPTVNEGELYLLSATANDPGNDDMSFIWEISQGGNVVDNFTTPANTLGYTPADDGVYDVKVWATDGTLTGGPGMGTLTVANLAPAASITGPAGVDAGQQISLAAVASDVAADTLGYAWSATLGGNAVDLSGVTTDGENFAFTTNTTGDYTFTVTVNDEDGGQAVVDKIVRVENAAPTVVINGLPGVKDPALQEGDTLVLTANAADNSGIASYAWTATIDGQAIDMTGLVTNGGTTLSVPFTDAGTFAASVTVADNDGLTATATTGDIIVENADPTVAITAPTGSLNEGDDLTFTAAVNDAGNDPVVVQWRVEVDGQAISLANTSGTTLVVPDAPQGSYVVSLTASDGQGGSALETATVSVDNVAPTISVNQPAAALFGSTVMTTIGVADEVDVPTINWQVTLNTVTVASGIGKNVSFDATAEGTYTISATADDGDAQVGDSIDVVIANTAPTLVVDAPQFAAVRNFGHAFSASVVDPEGFASITWDYGDGTTETFTGGDAEALSPSHAYAADGTYAVSVSVTDTGGLTATDSTSVTAVGMAYLPDPMNPVSSLTSTQDYMLAIGGTSADNTFGIRRLSNGRLKVEIDGSEDNRSFAPGRVVIRVGGGDNSATVQSNVVTPLVYHGNSGQDRVIGGGAGDIILGHGGNDHLNGGNARDIVVGGDGFDYLEGGTGEDLLLGERLHWSDDPVALRAIQREWLRTDRDADFRFNAISKPNVAGLNGTYSVNNGSVFDDGQTDTMVGDVFGNNANDDDVFITPTNGNDIAYDARGDDQVFAV